MESSCSAGDCGTFSGECDTLALACQCYGTRGGPNCHFLPSVEHPAAYLAQQVTLAVLFFLLSLFISIQIVYRVKRKGKLQRTMANSIFVLMLLWATTRGVYHCIPGYDYTTEDTFGVWLFWVFLDLIPSNLVVTAFSIVVVSWMGVVKDLNAETLSVRENIVLSKVSVIVLGANVVFYISAVFAIVAIAVTGLQQSFLYQQFWYLFGLLVLILGVFSSIYGGRLLWYFKKTQTLQSSAKSMTTMILWIDLVVFITIALVVFFSITELDRKSVGYIIYQVTGRIVEMIAMMLLFFTLQGRKVMDSFVPNNWKIGSVKSTSQRVEDQSSVKSDMQ